MHYYIEIEVSPFGILFVNKIYNPNMSNIGIKNFPINCDESGIVINTYINETNN